MGSRGRRQRQSRARRRRRQQRRMGRLAEAQTSKKVARACVLAVRWRLPCAGRALACSSAQRSQGRLHLVVLQSVSQTACSIPRLPLQGPARCAARCRCWATNCRRSSPSGRSRERLPRPPPPRSSVCTWQRQVSSSTQVGMHAHGGCLLRFPALCAAAPPMHARPQPSQATLLSPSPLLTHPLLALPTCTLPPSCLPAPLQS